MWDDASLQTLTEQRGQFLPFNPQINSVYALDIQNASGYAWHNFPVQNAHVLRLLLEKKPKYPKTICSVTRVFCPVERCFYTWSFVGIRSHGCSTNSPSGLTWSAQRPCLTPIPKTITGMWLAWRGDIYPREHKDNLELFFIVTLIKILVLGQENFLGQFLTFCDTIGLDGSGEGSSPINTPHIPQKTQILPFSKPRLRTGL